VRALFRHLHAPLAQRRPESGVGEGVGRFRVWEIGRAGGDDDVPADLVAEYGPSNRTTCPPVLREQPQPPPGNTRSRTGDRPCVYRSGNEIKPVVPPGIARRGASCHRHARNENWIMTFRNPGFMVPAPRVANLAPPMPERSEVPVPHDMPVPGPGRTSAVGPAASSANDETRRCATRFDRPVIRISVEGDISPL
jgi:hypothetical protein